MKLLLFFFVISSAFADSPPNCEELGKILQGYEVDLQKTAIKSCNTINLQTDIVKEASVKGTELISEYRCSDLATIEANLERLKNEDTILTGIHKLKTTIQASQAEAGNANLAAAQVAGKTFITSLTTAQSLELLVQSVTETDSPFLAELKKVPLENRRSSSDFKAAMREICKVKKNAEGVVDACDQAFFNPDEATIRELNALIDQAPDVAAQIPTWKRQLAIKRITTNPEESPYSFTQMRSEMESAFKKLDSKERLTRAELKAIQDIDKFENAQGLEYVENIALIKKQFKSQFAVDRFRFLVEDSIQRQKHEMQSKTSQFWAAQSQLGSITEEDKAICNEAKSSYDKAMACQYILKEKVDPALKVNAQFNQFLDATAAANTYINKLHSISNECLENVKNGNIDNSCLKEFTADQEKVKDQILQLHLLKEKIGQENDEAMKYRNFALQKFGSQRCYKENSSIEFCDEEDRTISPVASLLSDQLMTISVMFREAADKEQHGAELAATSSSVENLCNDSDKVKKTPEQRLCAFFNDTTSDVIVTDNEKKDEYTAPVTPEQRPSTAVRDAWLAGAKNIIGDVTRYYQNKNMMNNAPMNPYPYNFAPYNGGAGPRGIADTILFNAQAYGAYGFYAPTPGYKPYTAFGSSPAVSAYSGLSTGTASYFGK